MLIIQNGYECDYEMKLFYGLFFSAEEDICVFSNFEYKDKTINVYTEIIYGNDTYFDDYYYSFDTENKTQQFIKKVFTASCTKSFCHAAKKIKDINIPWGVMCGIRPAKNVRSLMEEGYSDSEVVRILKDVYEVSDEKIELAKTVAENEKALLDEIGENSVSIYIGIPFCPTRCLYCSFVSTDIRVSGKYMNGFVEKLLLEIDKTAEIIEKMGAYVENIYIGGGTPTTLEPHHLKSIFDRLKENFDFSKIKEFTLEAGRPDTITEAKLLEAKKGGVNRISINPQTMNNETLVKVGRKHTPDMVKNCFNMARRIGFDNINMDLIAGLPDETVDMFKYSIDEVINLDPENITVHSMAVKRAASLRFTDTELAKSKDMNEMLSYTQKRMAQTGRKPYYMYRQKNISGNLENVGYAKDGYMSTYNINIMEEKQTIIALGGGGSTKLVMGDRIERIFNFKDPLEYINRFDEILQKKDEILEIIGGENNG
ncbi:MAG: coproporphyrinogen dehydrogenase HemZ [Clostridia bacterium]|nr:coproporphyrinogen dehydrogenase HemZ [Clostridia bacterium]